MGRIKLTAVAVVAALVLTVIGVERPAAADEGVPIDAAAEVAVRLGGDGETLVVEWELWRGIPGAFEGIDEWVVSAPGADEVVVVPSSSVRAELEGLDPQLPHVISVRGRNAEGEGPAATGSFDPDAVPPGAVTSVDVRPSATSGQLLASWSVPVADPPVDVVRVTWPGGSQDVLSTDPQGLTIGGLTDGAAAVVTARARSADAWGPMVLAPAIAAGTPILPPPEVAAEATGEPGEVLVTWGEPTPGSDGLSPVEGFEVTWTGGGHLTVPGASSREATLTGLEDGREHDIHVASRNASGPGVRASVADVVPSGPPTAAPVGVTGEGTGMSGEVQLDWEAFDAEGDGGSPVTAFRVSGPGQTFDVTAPGQALVEGLTDGEAVELGVAAVNENGVGPSTSVEATPSGPPTGTVEVVPETTSTAGRLELSWDPVEGVGTGGSPITGYEVGVVGEDPVLVEADESDAALSGLTDGEGVVVHGRAVNVNGPGPWGSESWVVPGVPARLDVVRAGTIGASAAEISWDLLAAEREGTSPVTGHVVRWYDDTWTEHLIEVGPTVEEVVIDGLVAGSGHFVSVAAVNEHGESQTRGTSFVAGRPTDAPTISVEPTGAPGQVAVAWELPEIGLGAATAVEVLGPTGAVEVALPATSMVYTGLTDGIPVWFQARLRSPHGDGPYSSPSDPVASAGPPPVAPTVRVLPRPGELEVTWDAVGADGGSPLSGYRVTWESAAGSDVEVVGTTDLSLTIADLADGEPVAITVAAVNAHGDGPASTPITTAPGQLPVDAPTSMTATGTGEAGQLEVAWEPIDAGAWGSGTTREYIVSWGYGSVRVPHDETSVVLTDLAVGSYPIVVRAVTEVGFGPEGGGEWTYLSGPPEVVPTGVVARPTAVAGRAIVEWNPGPYKRLSADERDTWLVTWDGGAQEVPTSVRRVEISGLPADTPIVFEVRARSAFGAGPATAAAAIRANGVPPRPDLLGGVGDLDGGELGWTGMGAQVGRSGEVAESGRSSLRVELASWSDEAPYVVADAVPTVPGEDYVASVWVRATRIAEPRAAGLLVLWLDDAGAVVSESEMAFVEDVTQGWTEVGLSAEAPPGATVARLGVAFQAAEGEVFHLDGTVFGLDAEAAPNLLSERQSGFEIGAFGWTSRFGRIARSADRASDGWASLRVELDGRHDAGSGEAASISADPVDLDDGEPGGAVTASAQVRTGSGASAASASLTFVDADGVALDTSTGGEVAINAGAWTSVTVTGTAPATSTHAIVTVILHGEAGDVRFIDDVTVTRGTAPGAAANLLPDPTASFERDELGWLGSHAVVGANVDQSRSGMASLVVTGGSSPTARTDLGTAGAPVSTDHQYTASAWVRAWDEDVRDTTATITWFDAAGAELGTHDGETVVEAIDDWRQVWVTAVAPEGAVYASMAVTFPGAQPGEVHSIDDAAFCLGISPDCLPDVPPAVRPSDLSAQAAASISLTWTVDPSDQTAEGITGYRVWWDGGEVEVSGAGTAGTTLTDAELDAPTDIHVAAVNPHGEGPAATVEITPTVAAPDPPTDVTAERDVLAGDVLVSWEPPAAGPTPSGYLIRWGDQPDEAVAIAGDRTSAIVPGLDERRTHTFTVAATTAGGASAPSAGVAVDLTEGCAPSPRSGHGQLVIDDGATALYRLGERQSDPAARRAHDTVRCAIADLGTRTADEAVAGLPGALTADDDGAIGGVAAANEAPVLVAPLDGQPAGTADRTIELWARTLDSGPLEVTYGPEALLSIEEDGSASAGGDPASTVAEPGAWHHYAVTFAADAVRMYVDGVLVAGPGAATPVWPAGRGLDGDSAGHLVVWSGAVDELAIYPRALTAADVARHHQVGRSADTTTWLTVPAILPSNGTVRITAHVSHDGTTSGTPGGTVALSDDGEVIGTAPVDAQGRARFTVTLDDSPHGLIARYNGAAGWGPSRSQVVAERAPVGDEPTTVGLGTDVNWTTYGSEPVVEYPWVSDADGDPAEGEVEVLVDGLVVARSELDPEGRISFDSHMAGLEATAPGEHSIVYRYLGSPQHAASSITQEWTVWAAWPAVVSTEDPWSFHVISDGPTLGVQPMGVLEIAHMGLVLGRGQLEDGRDPETGAVRASLRTMVLTGAAVPDGSEYLNYSYGGDGRYGGTAAYIPGRVESGMELSSSSDLSEPASPPTFTADVSSVEVGPWDRTVVHFSVDGTEVAAVPVVDGRAVWTPTSLPRGARQVRARFGPYSGTSLPHTVGRPVAIALTASTLVRGTALSGTVTAADPAVTAIPRGTLRAHRGSWSQEVTLAPDGGFVLDTTLLEVGSGGLDLVFTPDSLLDGVFRGATASPPLAVTKVTPTIELDDVDLEWGESLTGRVVATPAGVGIPAGTVSLYPHGPVTLAPDGSFVIPALTTTSSGHHVTYAPSLAAQSTFLWTPDDRTITVAKQGASVAVEVAVDPDDEDLVRVAATLTVGGQPASGDVLLHWDGSSQPAARVPAGGSWPIIRPAGPHHTLRAVVAQTASHVAAETTIDVNLGHRTTIALTADPSDTSLVDDPVTVVASVSAATAGAPHPTTGSIELLLNTTGQVVAVEPIDAERRATFMFGSEDLPLGDLGTPGPKYLLARFVPADTSHSWSRGVIAVQRKQAPHITITPTPNPLVYDTGTRLSATIEAPNAGGTITFAIDGEQVGVATLSDGVATTAYLDPVPPGDRAITATYTPSGLAGLTYAASTARLDVTIARATPLIRVGQLSPRTYGDPRTIDVSVQNPFWLWFPEPAPTGDVNGVALDGWTRAVSTRPRVGEQVTLSYSGDAHFLPHSIDVPTNIVQADAELSLEADTIAAGDDLVVRMVRDDGVELPPLVDTAITVTRAGGVPVTVAGPGPEFSFDPTELGLIGGMNDIVVSFAGTADVAAVQLDTDIRVGGTPTVTIEDADETSVFGAPPVVTARVRTEAGDPTSGGDLVAWLDQPGGTSVELGRAAVDEDGHAVITPARPAPIGEHTLRVSYTGDDWFGPASSNAGSHQVTKATPAVTVSSPTAGQPGGSIARRPLELRVAVTLPGATVSVPNATGSVAIYEGSALAGAGSLVDGVADVTVTPSTAGTRHYEVRYLGAGPVLPGTGSIDVAVAKAPTTTTLAGPEGGRTDAGTPVTFVATVLDGQAPVVGGVVRLDRGSAALAQAVTDAEGRALFVVALPAGSSGVRATFDPQGDRLGSQSATLSHWVAREAALDVTPRPGVVRHGDPSTLDVVVTAPAGGPAPTGRVRIIAGDTALGPWATLTSGAAATTAVLPAGRSMVEVEYEGDLLTAASRSAPLDLVVGKAAPTVSVVVQPDRAPWSSPIVLTTTVTAPSGLRTAGGGVAVFDDAGRSIGRAQQLSLSGRATFAISDLDVGAHDLVIRYAGTRDIEAATSDSIEVQVDAAAPVFTVDAPSAIRDDGVGEIEVRVAAPSGRNARGPVELWSTTGTPALIDTATLDVDGRAAFTCAAAGSTATHPCDDLAPGEHRFRLVLPSSSGGIVAGQSAEKVIRVQAATVADLVVTPPEPGFARQEVDVHVAVVAPPGSHRPGGTVALLGADGEVLDQQPVEALGPEGRATLSFEPPAPGEVDLRVSYSGDEILGPVLSDVFDVEIRPSIDIVRVGPTPMPTTIAGVPSGDIVLEMRVAGVPFAAPAGGAKLSFGSTSRSTFVHVGGDDDATSVTIPAGGERINISVSDTAAGVHRLLVRAPELGISTWQQIPFRVERGPQSTIVAMPGEVSAKIGQPAPAIKVFASDADGNDRGQITDGLTFASPGATCTSSGPDAGVCVPTAAGDHTVTISDGTFTTTAVLHANTPPEPTIVDVRALDPLRPRYLTFTLAAKDDDDDPLRYGVFWGDGTASTEILDVPETDEFTVAHDFTSSAAAEVVFKVSDGKTISHTGHRVPSVEEAAPRADAGDNQVATAGTQVSFDGSGSRPDVETLEYQWDFGDGTERVVGTTEDAPQHRYTEPGQFVVTLRVRADSETSPPSTAIVTVLAQDGTGVYVDVQGSTGGPISGASVVVTAPDGTAHRGVESTVEGQYVIAGLPDGQHSAYIYANGYAPTVFGFNVTNGRSDLNAPPAVLQPGAAAEAQLTTRRLSHDEAVDLGVISETTEVEVVRQLELWLPSRTRPVTLFQVEGDCVAATDSDGSLMGDRVEGNVLFEGDVVAQPLSEELDAEVTPSVCELHIPSSDGGSSIVVGRDSVVVMNKTRASWAKEVFEAHLQVFNVAPAGFDLVAGTATLELPANGGLALAEMVGGTQTLEVGFPTIPAGSAQSIHWYLRGDVEGFYDLAADVTAILDPIGTPIHLRAATDPASQIHVWGTSALAASLEVDASVVPDAPFRQTLSVANVADVPAYNLQVGVDVGEPGAPVEILTQPLQEDLLTVDELAPGDAATSPEARLLYDDTDEEGGDRVRDIVWVETAAGRLPVVVTHRDDPTRLAAPVIEYANPDVLSAGASLSWEPVEGATRYAVYVTDDRNTAFPAEPIAETPGTETTVILPPQGGYGIIAVTALVDRGDGPVWEMSHTLLEAGRLAIGPDPDGARAHDPCRGFGTDPTSAYPGNFAFAATDASVASVGPPLAFTRTYNSFDIGDEGVGAGWTLGGLGPIPLIDPDGNSAVVEDDGACAPLTRDPIEMWEFRSEEHGRQWRAVRSPDLDPETGRVTVNDLTNMTSYQYTLFGQLLWAEDQYGHRTTYTYAPEATVLRRPLTITDESSGRTLHLSWSDDEQRLLEVATDPVTGGGTTAPLRWTYHYDGDLLTAVCDPRNPVGPDDERSCEVYGYGPDDRLRSITDREGETTDVLYDDEGRMTQVAGPTGALTTFAYGGDHGRDVTIKDPRGNVTTAEYDQTYRLVAASDAAGETVVDYDAHGYISSIAAPGQSVSIDSDPDGTPRSIASAAGTTSFDVEDGRVTEVHSPRGTAARMTYDAEGRLSSRTIPGTSASTSNVPDLVTSWSYTERAPGTRTRTTPADGGGFAPWGLVTEERRPVPALTDPADGVTRHYYDSQGNAVRTVSPSGAVVEAGYDDLGRRTSLTVSGPGIPTAVTTYTYDELGNVITELRPRTTGATPGSEAHQIEVETTYDGNNRPTRILERDVAGSTPPRERVLTYDGLGRVTADSVRVDASTDPVTTHHHYDAAGNEIETVDAAGIVRRRTFDAANRVVAEQVDGRLVSVSTYDGDGHLAASVDALGRRTTYAYDDAGRTLSVTRVDVDGAGSDDVVVEEVGYHPTTGDVVWRKTADGSIGTSYAYDEVGRLTDEVFDPGGLARRTEYEYDAAGNPSLVRRSGGQGQSYVSEERAQVFDAFGRVVEETVGVGTTRLTTTTSHDVLGRPIEVTRPGGAVVETTYDEAGRVLTTTGSPVPVEEETGPVAPVTTYEYDAFGMTTAIIDPLGRESRRTYNAAGWLTSSSTPTYDRPSDGADLVATTEYERDPLGRVIETTAPSGGTSTTEYDGFGHVVRSTRPGPTGAPVTTTNEYDLVGRLVETTSPSGLVTRPTYDGLDRVVATTRAIPTPGSPDPVVVTERSEYDDAGNVVRSVDAEGGISTSTYNTAGELVTSISPWQHQLGTNLATTHRYDGLGRPIEIIDELGGRSGTRYDGLGRAVVDWTMEGATERATVRAYDADGNVVTETSPAGRVTTSTYVAGRLSSVTQSPGGGVAPITTRFGYDLVGNRVRVTDGRGHVTETTYNAWDLPETVVEPETAPGQALTERTWTTSYDVEGRELVRNEPGGVTVTSTYDAAGNRTSEHGTIAGTPTPVVRELTFDDAGRVATAARPGGMTAYGYDARGLLVTQTGAGGTVDRMAYDGAGRLVEREDARGTATFDYGSGGLLEAMVDPVTGRAFSYEYDAVGRRIEEVATTPGYTTVGTGADADTQTTTWEHDDLGRVRQIEVTGPDGERRRREVTGYDADGNDISRTVTVGAADPVVEAFTIDGAGRLTSYTDITTSDPVMVAWDAAGNRTSVGATTYTYDARNRLTASSDGTTYTYDARGARTAVDPAVGPTRTSSYDALGQVVTDGDVTYTWDSQGRIATRTQGDGDPESFTYSGDDLDPIAVGDTERGTGPGGSPVSVDDSLVTTDVHGDIVLATDDGGDATATRYDPFGVPDAGGGAGPFGYQGDYTDPATDAVWMGARTYQPATATFTNRDTWPGRPTDPVTLNRYTYANANPLRYWDPTGRLSAAEMAVLEAGLKDIPSAEWIRAMYREIPSIAHARAAVAPGTTALAEENAVIQATPNPWKQFAILAALVTIVAVTLLVAGLAAYHVGRHVLAQEDSEAEDDPGDIDPDPPRPAVERWCDGPNGIPVLVPGDQPCPIVDDPAPGLDPDSDLDVQPEPDPDGPGLGDGGPDDSPCMSGDGDIAVVSTPKKLGFGRDDETESFMETAPVPDGTIAVIAHATEAGWGSGLTTERVVEELKRHPSYYDGVPILLYVCFGASNGVAEELADALDSTVTAPTKRIWLRRGTTETRHDPGGQMETFE